jgi:amino acid transporter
MGMGGLPPFVAIVVVPVTGSVVAGVLARTIPDIGSLASWSALSVGSGGFGFAVAFVVVAGSVVAGAVAIAITDP